MHYIQADKVDVGALHHVKRAGLRAPQSQDIDVVQLAVADVHEARNWPAQVAQRVPLHRRFGDPKVRPREDRKTPVDGGRASHPFAPPPGVALPGLCRQTGFDVAPARAPRQRRKRHDPKRLGASECAYARVAAIARHAAPTACPRHEVHTRRNQRLADVYVLLRDWQPRENPRIRLSHSSRHQMKLYTHLYLSKLCCPSVGS